MKRLAALTLVILAGCASFGLEAPKSIKEQIAYGYSTLAGLRNSAAAAIQLGTLSPKDGEAAQGYADQARQGLDAARFASSNSCPDGLVHGLVPVPPSSGSLTQAAGAMVQVIRCDPKQTPIDQLALANKVLIQLTQYLQARGIKTGLGPRAVMLATI